MYGHSEFDIFLSGDTREEAVMPVLSRILIRLNAMGRFEGSQNALQGLVVQILQTARAHKSEVYNDGQWWCARGIGWDILHKGRLWMHRQKT